MTLGRRQLLQGLAATGAAALVAPGNAVQSAALVRPHRRRRVEPEPLRVFPGLGEGFYRHGRHVYYIDEQHSTWAPAALAAGSLVPISPLAGADLHLLLSQLRKRHWTWCVEHAVLSRLATDRPLAIALLSAALDLDRARPLPSARRLHALASALSAPRRTSWRAAATDGQTFATRIAAV